MSIRKCGGGALCAMVVLMAPREAAACSGPTCMEPMFFPARGSVPANLPAVLFWPATPWGEDGGVVGVRFVRLDEGPPREVAFTLEESDEPSGQPWVGSQARGYRIVPGEPLVAGGRYALWAERCFGGIAAEPPREASAGTFGESSMLASWFAVLDVTPEAPLPGRLGAVTLSSPRREQLQIGGGSGCADRYEASTVMAGLDGSTAPWTAAIAFTTWVDGEAYLPSDHLNYLPAFGDSWVGHGRDLLANLCVPSDQGTLLEPGRHSLQFRGAIPGTDVVLESDVAELDMPACSTDDAGTGAGGAPPVSNAGGNATAAGGASNSGVPAAEGGSSSGASADEGCSVGSPAGRGRGMSLLALAAGFGLLAARRRRISAKLR